jgi:hypothetical protein
MIVNTKTLLELPIGTLFHESEKGTIYEIVGYTQSGDDLMVVPIFNGFDAERRCLGVTRYTSGGYHEAQWYILNREDKNVIARKMGFESAGIRVIGFNP